MEPWRPIRLLPPTTVEGMVFENKNAEQPGAVEAGVKEGPGIEGTKRETADIVVKEAEIAPETEKIECPTNAGDA